MVKYKLGIDIGSTTMKVVVADVRTNEAVFDRYVRHNAKINECLIDVLKAASDNLEEDTFTVCVTGSIGMGIAEKYKLPFLQEVVAASYYISAYQPNISTMIDIGGEDSKMAFFDDGIANDLRMNGNCAGGTGAFIDQMSILLNVSPEELNTLAENATNIYPIASRCGVFSKTDVQNLIARNAAREDIAASIFRAVSVQTISTLARGKEIKTPILLCGGPLTYLSNLRKSFSDYLEMPISEFVVPEKSQMIPAWGCALYDGGLEISIIDLIKRVEKTHGILQPKQSALSPIFTSEDEYLNWQKRMESYNIERAELTNNTVNAYLGIDSGSTTTKIVVIDDEGKMLFSHYHNNNGDPVNAVKSGLNLLLEKCREKGTTLNIKGSCSTGYGEDLVKAAFRIDYGIVETMAHYMAAKRLDSNVTFILDIGGQDMKAIFVDNGVITRIEVNEACSSGCGSFISTFASSLNYDIEDFAHAACFADSPCDLGTRCTVFMNSKVKQVLREGTSVDNIAAGLTYSVVRNCLYKVLQLKDTAVLGDRIVVQGGTMRNDSVVRAFEIMTGKNVSRSNCPELMGALGCAYYAKDARKDSYTSLEDMLSQTSVTTRIVHCHGCSNNCAITQFRFANNNIYYSGNRCEKVFTNKGKSGSHCLNAYEIKLSLLFDRGITLQSPLLTIGIPKCLNMYEEYPFWHTLFTECNIDVKLSADSEYKHYERCVNKVMSDNICMPAKVVHSHIDYLVGIGVDRIFMPFVVYEKQMAGMQNSYNCPVVSGYSQVIRSAKTDGIPVDSPTISFKDNKSLYLQCKEYLCSLGVSPKVVRNAFKAAVVAQESYERDIISCNENIYEEAQKHGELIVMLAGRPYHSDMLIQHKVSDMIAAQGVCVITDDYVRNKDFDKQKRTEYLSQWSFPNHIFKAAQWVAQQPDNVQFMQLTSFGCGPDAFIVDEIRSILSDGLKNCTILKIDDVNNIGSLKLRVRSLVESLSIKKSTVKKPAAPIVPELPAYTKEQTGKTIIFPFFTPFMSPLIPDVFSLAGYRAESLPMSDNESEYWGLKYSNNEICYPATLVVGDIVKAFKSGKYDPDNTCVAMTQTGGQCRASNYLSLIRKALIENGYNNTPTISISIGSGLKNNQPSFKVNWIKLLPVVAKVVLYADTIARFYYSSVVRENEPGAADRLRDKYITAAKQIIANNQPDELYNELEKAANEFNCICKDVALPKVGIVGEIFLKYHPFAQKQTTDWLVKNGIEVVYPALSDFFLQGLVNIKEQKKEHLTRQLLPDFVYNLLVGKTRKIVDKVNQIGHKFRYFIPFDDIFDKAELARNAISLSARFGEGWLIAGEISSLAEQGVRHFISLQPFGCIANHIVQKGIENKLKSLYPQINILSLDFDSSVSEVNISNRLFLFINNINDRKNGNKRK